ncbi:V-type ATP synthase subunit I [Candidatus Woesearchaeota archaeon]|nr:V-type ATP synthase subunit I [Candidatus Woesearchaeota archaeon]
MFAPERMKKVTVIGPKNVMDRAVMELHKLKAVHITDHQKDEFDIGSPFERADKLSELLVTVRAILSALGISGRKELLNGFRAVGVKNLAGLRLAVKKLNDNVNVITASSKNAEDELKKLSAKEAQISYVKLLGLSLDSFSDYKSLAYFVGVVKDTSRLRESVLALTNKFELFSATGVDKGHPLIVALFVDASKKAEVADALAGSGFSELPIAEVKGLTGSVASAAEAVARRKEKLQAQLGSNKDSLAKLGVKWHDFLLLGEQLLVAELEKAQAPLRFAVSRNAFVVRGWVPAREVKMLESRLGRATGERIFVEAELPHHDEKVPVKLDNPKHAKPFEFFMNLYALPKYDEIDPTLFMFITFPLFFGFILGDVGYGLVSFFLLLWLKEKFSSASKLVNVLIPAVLSSIVFGFLYGEIFGFEQAFGMEFPRVISRAHSVNEMLIVAVVIGLIHVNLGFVLGFVNELKHKGLFKAFCAKLSWIILQLGVVLWVFWNAKAGIAVSAAAVALIYIGESIRGMVELPGLLSNVVSYTRLAAVGLSSVMLAGVINDISKDIAQSGTLGIAASVIILFIGHTINLALGLLGSFLQSLRLHYVEFFTKFFEGGAAPFKPFGAKD